MTAEQLFREATNEVLTDESFKLPSTHARMALETAVQLKAWMNDEKNDHSHVYGEFIRTLFDSLQGCFDSVSPSLKTHKESMWKAFHKLQTSPSFVSQWKHFLAAGTSVEPTPAFYQHITMTCFKELIKVKFSVAKGEQDPDHSSRTWLFKLSCEEANALRYAAGYVCHKLIKKLEVSSMPRRMEMITLLSELANGKGDGTAEEWTNLLDRGGLCHISENTPICFLWQWRKRCS